jgi:hypothetical protein
MHHFSLVEEEEKGAVCIHADDKGDDDRTRNHHAMMAV